MLHKWHPCIAAALCAVMLVSAAPASGQDWVDTLRPVKPGNFPVVPDVELEYDFGWSGVKAAEAKVRFERTGHSTLSMSTEVRTTGAARALWRLDADGSSSVDVRSMRPQWVQQVERYRRETKAHRLDFRSDQVLYQRLKPKGRGLVPDGKPQEIEGPRMFDMSTALLFFRSQRMRQGDVYRAVALPARTPYLATLTVGRTEKRKSRLGEIPVIRCDLKLERINSKQELEPHRRVRSITVWITDDALRLPLRIEAEVFVGNVFAELQSVTMADGSPSPYVVGADGAGE